MFQHRCLAVVLLLLFLVVASARAETPSRQVPGGPILQKAPDLFVESIAFTFPAKTPCVGANTAVFEVSVTVKNGWLGDANMPGAWPPPWVLVWSALGGVAPPYMDYLGYPLKTIAAGQSYTFKTKITFVGNYSAAAGKTVFMAYAQADPNNAIVELNENNNEKHQELSYSGQLCK